MLTHDRAHLDYTGLLRAAKKNEGAPCRGTQRIAVLSDAAVPQLVPVLKALLARHDIRGEIYLAEYDSIELEVFNEASGLYGFAPDAVVLLNSLNALRLKYHREFARRDQFAEQVVAHATTLWNTIRSRLPAVQIQSNYPLPYERMFGNFDHKVPSSFYATVLRVNERLSELARARTDVFINDVEGLASYVGRRAWSDERLWTLAKAFCALEHLPMVGQNIVDILLSNLGHVVKCVVVDLDNTLWGGVIGDDGLEGITVGPFGHGEPFYRLQLYLLELKRRGILLAVCSKNEHSVAVEPFRRHPEMALREEDVAVFVANWEPKPDNIVRIKEALNIGLDSMVFLDDNVFERQLVRQTLPEVIVPELPDDPADYVRVISELNLFETSSFSEEDRKRADLHRANESRISARAGFTDIGEYLRSLDMRVVMRRFDEFHLPRIAQLIQRSNQFNLTTRRYSLAECEELMRREGDCLPLYLKLSDKFGDNGLISVIILRLKQPVLEVDSWLMSCRVLGRGIEEYAMNRVVALASDHGCDLVVGRYLPTPKNRMVRDFFQRFGFEAVEERDDGAAVWWLRVPSYRPRQVHMTEEV